MPDVDRLKQFQLELPEAYQQWMEVFTERAKHDMWMERAPLELPARLARRGQIAGIVGLLVVAGLAAFAMWLNHPWVAGIFGVLDFVGVVAAFQDSDRNEGRAPED